MGKRQSHSNTSQAWLGRRVLKMIYPITLGCGKRLFGDGTVPAALKVTETAVTPKGVIVVRYEREGEIKTQS